MKVTLDFLKQHDPQYYTKGTEIRFLCPFGAECQDKPKDNRHRSLCVNTVMEVWVCKRCGEKGKVGEEPTENRKPKPKPSKDELKKRQEEKEFGARRLKEETAKIVSLRDSQGLKYLTQKRKLNPDICLVSGVKYCPDWFGGKAVLFAIRDNEDKVVAINARYITEGRYVQHRSSGEKSKGVFKVAGAMSQGFLIVTEAPIDALSLAMVNLPAVATCGEGLPSWFYQEAINKTVFLATDDDEAGNKMAFKIGQVLKALHIKWERLLPSLDSDWNRVLVNHGYEALRDCGIVEFVQRKSKK